MIWIYGLFMQNWFSVVEILFTFKNNRPIKLVVVKIKYEINKQLKRLEVTYFQQKNKKKPISLKILFIKLLDATLCYGTIIDKKKSFWTQMIFKMFISSKSAKLSTFNGPKLKYFFKLISDLCFSLFLSNKLYLWTSQFLPGRGCSL